MRNYKKFYVVFLLAAVFGVLSQSIWGQSEKPKPNIADGKYGPHERNVFDLWIPRSSGPTPLIVYIHGGGFNSGSKDNLTANQLNAFLRQNYAVMTINYRLLPDAVFPDHYMDAVRAIQFARSNAKEWNIDKSRVAATGS